MDTAKFNSASDWKKVFFNHVNQIHHSPGSIPFNCIPSHSEKDANLSPWSTRPNMTCLPLSSLIYYHYLLCSLHPKHTSILALPRTCQAHFCLMDFVVLVCPPDTHFSQIFAWFILLSSLCSNDISSKKSFMPSNLKTECLLLLNSFALLYLSIQAYLGDTADQVADHRNIVSITIKWIGIFLQVEGLAFISKKKKCNIYRVQ